MINSIKLKGIATYTEDVSIDNLKRINHIYGSNGSGKTTISNFLLDSEKNDTNVKYPNCNIDWDSESHEKILVYNKKFREENFLATDQIKGVFTLGKASKEEIENINNKNKELDNIISEGKKRRNTSEKKKNELEKAETDFKKILWENIYKKYKNNFEEAFVGYKKKEAFFDKICSTTPPNSELNYDSIKKRAEVLFNQTPTQLQQIRNINFDDLIKIENATIWNKIIIGKSDIGIAKLIKELQTSDWVNRGRSFLKDDSDICPFCQQKTITKDFRAQLEQFFDLSYQKDIKSLNESKENYQQLSENVLNVLKEILQTEKNNKNSKLDVTQFSNLIKIFEGKYTINKELINQKVKEPSRKTVIQFTQEVLYSIQELITKTNKEIKDHNIIVANYRQEKEKLIKEIWQYITKENYVLIQTHLKKISNIKKGLDGINKGLEVLLNQHKTLKDEIVRLNRNITSIQPSIDEINRILKGFGFNNFEIVKSPDTENSYQIQRADGSLAKSTLSEGEISFITFLYFLQLAKGGTSEEEASSARILVIDDPISSLDSNILFIVSSLIKELRKGILESKGLIKQMIILTHNVYFHKEVSFINGKTEERNDINFWILRKNNNITSIEAFKKRNPIQNSYELLWNEIDKEKNNASTIQNTMRRIIECYFKILGKCNDEDIIRYFKSLEEKEICRSLLCWINDGSHCIPDDLYIENPNDVIDKYFIVFKKIFELSGHIEHYNMMMREEENNK